jgi:hypothetical protein
VTGVQDFMKPDIHQNVEKVVNTFFDEHKQKGFARYNSAAELSPMHQEIWAHKTCDHYQTVKPGLSIIEGIYGRSGDGFGVGEDYLTNLVMFGQDRINLDLIGMFLGGHEPGNVNLFRIAKERGISTTINPWEVELYEWVNGAPVRRKLSDFTRTNLNTYYLQKEGEPKYHLVNERFDYDKFKT